MMSNSSVSKTLDPMEAKMFAYCAHRGADRKYTGEPYIAHVEDVAHLVQNSSHGQNAVVCAAWLHDVVEDTPTKIETIAEVFGLSVSYLVFWLTDEPKRAGTNRAERKEVVKSRFKYAPPEAKTIKLADTISNMRSIVMSDPKFAVTYVREKEELMPYLEGGDYALFTRAQQSLKWAKAYLEDPHNTTDDPRIHAVHNVGVK